MFKLHSFTNSDMQTYAQTYAKRVHDAGGSRPNWTGETSTGTVQTTTKRKPWENAGNVLIQTCSNMLKLKVQTSCSNLRPGATFEVQVAHLSMQLPELGPEQGGSFVQT